MSDNLMNREWQQMLARVPLHSDDYWNIVDSLIEDTKNVYGAESDEYWRLTYEP